MQNDLYIQNFSILNSITSFVVLHGRGRSLKALLEGFDSLIDGILVKT